MTETWNPEQYEKYGDQRRRPFADLTSRVAARSPAIVVDLGCGSGAATLELAALATRADHRSRLLRRDARSGPTQGHP
jgi:trans-aconitate methyltransferase